MPLLPPVKIIILSFIIKSENTVSDFFVLEDYKKLQFPSCYSKQYFNFEGFKDDSLGSSSEDITNYERKELRKIVGILESNHKKITKNFNKSNYRKALKLSLESLDLVDSSQVFKLSFLKRFKYKDYSGGLAGRLVDSISAGQYSAVAISYMAYNSAAELGFKSDTQIELLNQSLDYSRWIFANRGCSDSLRHYIDDIDDELTGASNICSMVASIEAKVAEKLFHESYKQNNLLGINLAHLSLTNYANSSASLYNFPNSSIVRLNILIRLGTLAEKKGNNCMAHRSYDRSLQLANILEIKSQVIQALELGKERTSNFENKDRGDWDPKYGKYKRKNADYLMIKQIPPKYPSSLFSRGLEGCVLVGYTITQEGKTADHEVIWSTDKRFDKAAFKSSKSFIFSPPIKEDMPIVVEDAKSFITFKIQEDGKNMSYSPPGCE